MKSITITQLHYIVQVAKLGHFGRAAKTCFVTQPTLSMQIQKLESDLDVTLFDRTKKPIQPTPMGHQILAVARNILHEVEKIEEVIKGDGEIRGSFQLGIIPTLAPYLLPLFLHHFLEKFPDVDLSLEELQTEVLIKRLKEGSLDAGLLVTPLGNRSLQEHPLFEEPFMAYLSPDHPLCRKKKIAQKDLSLSEVWLLNEGHCFRDQALSLCKARKQGDVEERHVQFESGNLETLRKLVDSRAGYTLLPYLATLELSKKKREQQTRPFESPVPTRQVSLITNPGFLKTGILEALQELILAQLPGELKSTGEKTKRIGLPSFG